MGTSDFLEADIETRLIAGIHDRLGLCLKIMLAGMTGFPDRTCLLPGGRLVFVELKKPGGRLSKRQILWHATLRQLGFRVEIIWNFQQVIDFLIAL